MRNTDINFDQPRSARRRTPTPSRPAPALNSCAVCGLRADVLLCRECAEHPEVSRILVRNWLKANTDQANALLDAWDAVRAPQQDAWEKVMDAHDQPNYAVRCAAHRASGNVYGQLLDAHAAYEAALQPLDIERARLERAMEILSTL